MSHQHQHQPWYRPAPTKEEYPDQEEYEERLSRWHWTVGRNMAFADLRAKTAQENQPAVPPEPETQPEPQSSGFDKLVTRLMAQDQNKGLTREQVEAEVLRHLEASGG